MLHRVGDDAGGNPMRVVQDQRHVQGRVVGEEAVRHFAVLAERFAVIRRQHNHRVAACRRVEHRLQQRAERGVNRGDFAEVRRAAIPRRERLRRRVRKMRLVHVHPREPRRGVARDPRQRRGDRVGAAPLRNAKRDGAGLVLRKVIVVDVETWRQTEARIERKGADERAGAVVPRAQQRRQRRDLRRKTEAGVFAHAVAERIQAREDGGMRRQGDDGRGAGLGESDAAGRQPIDPRGRRGLVAVGAERIGAERVDGDEEHIGRRAPRHWTIAARAHQRRHRRRRGERGPAGRAAPHQANPCHTICGL